MRICKVFKTICAVLMICCVFVMGQTADAAASKTKVNIITQLKQTRNGTTYTQKFTYNKKGLLTRKTESSSTGTTAFDIKYTYGSNNMVKTVLESEFGVKRSKSTYTYDKKNRPVKRVTKMLNPNDKTTVTTKYSYNKSGNLIKRVISYKGSSYIPDTAKFTTEYSYNKKGVLTKRKIISSPDFISKGTYSYKFDSNGFMKKCTYKLSYGEGSLTKSLTYKNKKLIKYKDIRYEGGEKLPQAPCTVKTKTLSVSKKLAEIIKKQQQEIINGDYCGDSYLGY